MNQEQYWFKKKKIGYGWTPATREGWFITALFLGSVIAVSFYLESKGAHWSEALKVYIVFLIVFFIVIFKTGEPLWKNSKK